MKPAMWAHAFAASAGVATGLLLQGCATTHGTRPPLEALHESLRPGESRKPDVLAALGEPRGYGAARLPTEGRLRTVWLYEMASAELLGSDVEVSILLVFFDADLYIGHLSFEGKATSEVHL